MPSSLDTRESLVHYATMVIFNCSAKHYAVSAGQVRWGSARVGGWRGPGSGDSRCLLCLQFDSSIWMPNLPPTMQLPPPTSKGQTEPEGFIATLPAVNATCDIIVTLWLLSKEPGDRVSVGRGGRARSALGDASGFCSPPHRPGPDPTLPSRSGVPSPHGTFPGGHMSMGRLMRRGK